VRRIIAAIFAVLLITPAPVALAASNSLPGTVAVVPSNTGTNDAVEQEFKRLMEADDDAQAEVDEWIRKNDDYAAQGVATPAPQLKQRIEKRLEPVQKAYEEFLKRHPEHVRARVAYASFLGDTKDEESAMEQLEKALALDTNNPAIYNNLANIYGHIGPVKKAFEFYGKAIQLNPIEPVYYHNFGTTVYLFRNDAQEHFKISEAEVFAKAFSLYSNAMRLDPHNFNLATDIAQTYYGIQPMRTEEALRSWTNALSIAHDEIEREGVYIHFARIKFMAGRLAEARGHLNQVTNAMYADLKKRLVRNVDEATVGTNAPAATSAPKN
jgi:tetratricopeptide (TPR) repeat protein